tara:strand:- start:201 stop:326 length:126 start_codon:yes stop_codon:yes gene_type:complete
MQIKKLDDLNEYTTLDKIKDLGGLFLLVGLGYILTTILFLG